MYAWKTNSAVNFVSLNLTQFAIKILPLTRNKSNSISHVDFFTTSFEVNLDCGYTVLLSGPKISPGGLKGKM